MKDIISTVMRQKHTAFLVTSCLITLSAPVQAELLRVDFTGSLSGFNYRKVFRPRPSEKFSIDEITYNEGIVKGKTFVNAYVKTSRLIENYFSDGDNLLDTESTRLDSIQRYQDLSKQQPVVPNVHYSNIPIKAGDTISGYYVMDTNAPFTENNYGGVDYDNNAVKEFSYQIGSFSFSLNPSIIVYHSFPYCLGCEAEVPAGLHLGGSLDGNLGEFTGVDFHYLLHLRELTDQPLFNFLLSNPASTVYQPINLHFKTGQEEYLTLRATPEFTIRSVPIPATFWLFGSGVLGLICQGRRKLSVY